jgi:hypothetical protein
MTGKHILDLMQQEGYSVNKMAELIGTSQPNLLSALKHTDIRTGLLEKIAQAMGKPLSFFYGEAYGSVTVAGNNNATAINNSTATATANDDRLLTLLVNKDEQLTMAMRQTSKAQEQTSKAQEQMDRVLDKFLGRSEDV